MNIDDPVDRAVTLEAVRSRLFGAGSGEPKLARYRLEHRLGAGGAGVVYRAYDTELDREVALKFVHRSGFNSDGRGETRLRSEAQLMAQVHHPNVVTLYDIGWYASDEELGLEEPAHASKKIPKQGLYLVMEYVDGVTLSAWRTADKRSRARTMDVLLDAGRGLAAAHDQGVVHRDFKPGNVLVSRAGAHVVDFGLASTGQARDEFVVAGSPAYMAPEQHVGSSTDARTDQYGFCVTAFEALVGVRPFRGPTLEEFAQQKAAREFSAVPKDRRLPRRVWAVLRRGLSPYPSDRFEDMHALLRAFEGRRRAAVVRTVAFAGLAAVTLGSVGALAVPKASYCELQAAAVDQIWSPEKASTLETVLSPEIGPEEWEQLRAGIDLRARRWAELERRACEASSADPADTVSKAQRECLQLQLYDLKGLVEVLADADGAVGPRARELEASLGRVERCLSPPGTGFVRLPAAGDQRMLALEIRSLFARARALELAGRVQDAESTLQEAFAWARDADEVTLALAFMRHANLRAWVHDDIGAEADLREAWKLAERTGEDGLALDAMILLSTIETESMSTEQGLHLLEVVDARLERFGDEGYRVATSSKHRAVLLSRQGLSEAALASARRATELLEALYGTHAPQLTAVLNTQGYVQHAAGRDEAALRSARRVFEISAQHYGPASPAAVLALHNIGAVLTMQGKGDEAVPVLEAALDGFRALYGDASVSAGMVFNNLGAAHLSQGNVVAAADALRRSLRAYETGGRASEVGSAYAHGNLATVLRAQGDRDGTATERRIAIALWSAVRTEAHPEAVSAQLDRLVDNATFDPSEASFAALERMLNRVIGDRAIQAESRAEAAFLVARHLHATDPERSSLLLATARELGPRRVHSMIERWERDRGE